MIIRRLRAFVLTHNNIHIMRTSSKRAGVIKIKTSISDIVDRFNDTLDTVREYVVCKDEELAALKIALLLRQHVMLVGKWGIAKSRLALALFSRFKGGRVFDLLLQRDSTPDDILGPPNPKVLRDQGRLEVNTEGMLPEAHFAYLDEFMNARGATLMSLLSVLNERRFTFGGKVLSCPLHTAVATTNIIQDSVELAPLVDRFLIVRPVTGASSTEQLRAILSAHASHRKLPQLDEQDKFALSDLQRLSDAVVTYPVPEALVNTALNVREKYLASLPEAYRYISDRRMCWVMDTIRASLFLKNKGEPTSDVESDISAMMILDQVFARRTTDLQQVSSILLAETTAMVTEHAERKQLVDAQAVIAGSLSAARSLKLPLQRRRRAYVRLRSLLMQLADSSFQASIVSPVVRAETQAIVTSLIADIGELEVSLGQKDDSEEPAASVVDPVSVNAAQVVNT